MRTYELPYDPDGAYEFDDESGTWLPVYCPLCLQGFLSEERVTEGYMYTCYHPRHPMYCCHTRFYVPDGLEYGLLSKSLNKLRKLGVLNDEVTP